MPPKNPFSRKTATTYALVHRPQDDPLIHDDTAPSQVFTEISGPSSGRSKSNKIKQRGDLEEEFALSYRPNEGEAAEHGVFFDDSQYDYMQHMRDLGSGGGDAAWIEPKPAKGKGKDKGKQKLEDALRGVSLDDEDELRSQGGVSTFSSAYSEAPVQRSVVEQQQDVPDALKGFQPDMDPRLREVLEALDDEAYVDDEEDVFQELAGEGEEVDQYEWEAYGQDFADEDEGWESDDTEKPAKEYNTALQPSLESHQSAPDDNDAGGGVALPDPHAAPPDAEHALPDTSAAVSRPARITPTAPSLAPTTASSIAGPRKKRKGALTSQTGGSMSSSVLARSETMSTLDSRFDRVLDQYMDGIDEEGSEFDENASLASGMTGMTGMSRASQWTTGTSGQPIPRLMDNRALDGVMDQFLSEPSGKKGRRMKKGGTQGTWGQQGGMEQLDEVRKGLGPARFKGGGSRPGLKAS